MFKRKLHIVLCMLAYSINAIAQDPQFTQFYAAPLYLNPALAGADVCSRVSLNYRNQWSAISKGFVTQGVAADHFIPQLSCGLGLMVMSDQAGTGKLRTTSVTGMFAYETNVTKRLAVRAGLSAGVANTSVNFSDLTFGDQIARGNATQSVENPDRVKLTYLDIGVGAVAYTPKYWAGFSVKHLNKPNQALVGDEAILPRTFSVHGGWRLPLGNNSNARKQIEKKNITPCINYRSQAKYDQLDVGMYVYRYPIVIGGWYRGLPTKAYQAGYANNDAIAVLAGVQVNTFKFGYSFDMSRSRLTGLSKGSHEISLTYQFCSSKELKQKKKKRKVLIPCAKF